jgi:hypothetical protein
MVHGLTGVKVTLVEAGEENVKVNVELAPCAEAATPTKQAAIAKRNQRILISFRGLIDAL